MKTLATTDAAATGLTASVVIPSYNHAGFLAQAIESALCQSHAPLEILVVDDGSTDETPQVLRRYADRVRCILRPHVGIGETYNYGVREARGEIVAFLESDDLWAATYLEETVGFLRTHPDVDWINTARDLIDQRGQHTGKQLRKPSGGIWFTTESLLSSDFGYSPTPVVRRAALLEVGAYDPVTYAADCDIALRFSLRHKMAYLDRPLYLYRRHGANASVDRLRNARENVRVLERFAAEHAHEIRPYRDLLRHSLAQQQGRVGVFTLEDDPLGDGSDALRHLSAALRNHPTKIKHLRRWLAATVLGPRNYGKLRRSKS